MVHVSDLDDIITLVDSAINNNFKILLNLMRLRSLDFENEGRDIYIL